MKKFQIIPHTADIRLQVEGDSLKELFINSLAGMNQILKKGFCQDKKIFSISRKIQIASNDSTNLLIDFLSEALTLSNINQCIFCQVEFDKLNKTYLSATLSGAKVRNFTEDIKAVSYHEAQVEKDRKGIYQTTIVFDI